MLSIATTVIATLLFPLQGITPIAASPIRSTEFVKRQTAQFPGQAVWCSLNGECVLYNIRPDNNYYCTDFTGDYAFLNDHLSNVTVNDMTCVAYGSFGCTGTYYSGGYSDPWDGPVVIDYTNFKGNGSDFSTSISSLKCSFI
ncbi:hypothetical protein NP233_g880 [Leucocoprinus birnbaumii]|uniref:Uncharacterized protein n=1 Tax=Leucocoprinus birnbaumii TaxID=56174 RepID=A0AAD5W3T2_9AGAR|nr:hypothetical protein NP233_g880 [Leucocoprinus birnbaumii]